MANFSLHKVLRFLRGAACPPGRADDSDARLLEQFAASGEEGSFRALVGRHGPAVLGIGRRILRDDHLAEDVFQATFLVLAKKAGSVRQGHALRAWLYRVAFHLALRVRRHSEAQWPTGEPIEVARKGADPTAEDAELRAVVAEEVGRLPEKYRTPVVLCYWEGLTYEEAASVLGCPAGTVSGRLARARTILRDRLLRRGVSSAVTAATLGAALPASARLPDALAQATVECARALASGGPVAAVASAHVVALMEGALGTMDSTRIKLFLATLVLGGAGTALGVWVTRPPADPPAPQPRPGLVASNDAPPEPGRKDAVVPVPDRAATSFALYSGGLLSVCFSPDGEYVLGGGGDLDNGRHRHRVKLWHLAQRKEAPGPPDVPNPIRAIALSPDGKHLAICCSGALQGAVNRPWHVKRGELLLVDATGKKPTVDLRTPSLSFGCVAFSPDSKTLAAGSDNKDLRGLSVNPGGVVRLFDAARGKETKVLKGHQGLVSAVAFSPDGTLLASASYSPPLVPSQPEAVGQLKLWNVATGKEVAALQGHKGGVWCVAFSPDGSLVASGGKDGVIRLWDVARGREVAGLKGHAGTVVALAFSPDGKTLASGAGDLSQPSAPGELKLWDVSARKGRGMLKGHATTVVGVAFDWEGKRLLSGDFGGTVKLWDLTGPASP